jgi:arsenate reductase (thioredoxin)
MNQKPLVLILCTGNSCRSQMAEGFLRHYQGDRYAVASAGTDPKPRVHPLAIQVMAEIGIDISRHAPESIDVYLGRRPVRHLITVCDRAQGTCPRVWPGAYTRDYLPFEDPAEATASPEQVLRVFRRVRDEIGRAMEEWTPVAEKAGAR